MEETYSGFQNLTSKELFDVSGGGSLWADLLMFAGASILLLASGPVAIVVGVSFAIIGLCAAQDW